MTQPKRLDGFSEWQLVNNPDGTQLWTAVGPNSVVLVPVPPIGPELQTVHDEHGRIDYTGWTRIGAYEEGE